MKTFLTANWENLVMINYEVKSSLLLPYLPKGLELDGFDGKILISLVGFMFKNSKIFGLSIPFFGSFEEVNLRFYVKRKVGGEIRRGVVFINETVPNKIVAWVANKLYKEHYTAAITQHSWSENKQEKQISYGVQFNKKWNNFKVIADSQKKELIENSQEKFIFEHYYGYTKLSEEKTLEYKVNHPSWEIHHIKKFSVDFNFGAFYGKDFAFLNLKSPHSVMLAIGSAISVDWKRIEI